MSIESFAAVDTATGKWISAGLSSPQVNEVYFFIGNDYVLINYAPDSTKGDFIVDGPGSIESGFPSLANNLFAELGIDCAFRVNNGNEAFIFCEKFCARWEDFAPTTEDGTKNDNIPKGPVTIGKMFPFLKGTVFENGIDAAFESTTIGEAYLFKGKQCASINYTTAKLKFTKHITQVFPSLEGTTFETGVEAAFASHVQNEAYLFKGDSYVRFNFGSGNTTDSKVSVQKILPNWPSFKGILPRKN